MESLIPIAIAIVESRGRFLIGRRPRGTVLADLWEFPGGKVHAGEKPEDAVVRECMEETGLRVAVAEHLLSVTHRYEHGHLHLHYFSCSPVDPRQTLRTSHRWVKRTELADYSFPEANKAVLDLLLDEH